MTKPNQLIVLLFLTTKLLLINLFCIAIFSGCSQKDPTAIEIANSSEQLQMLRVTGLALSPTFEITQKHYVSTADYSVTKISMQAWGKQPDANIMVNGRSLKDDSDFTLVVGNNIFTISVSDNDKITDQYQLTVVRLPEHRT